MPRCLPTDIYISVLLTQEVRRQTCVRKQTRWDATLKTWSSVLKWVENPSVGTRYLRKDVIWSKNSGSGLRGRVFLSENVEMEHIRCFSIGKWKNRALILRVKLENGPQETACDILVTLLHRNWNTHIFSSIFAAGIIEHFVLISCSITSFSSKVGRIGWKWTDLCDAKTNLGRV